jgi:hypothetical protein
MAIDATHVILDMRQVLNIEAVPDLSALKKHFYFSWSDPTYGS